MAAISEDEQASAAATGGRAANEHDYRRRDVGNLRRRQRVYAAVARLLTDRRDDPIYVQGLSEAAQRDAWGEIADAIEARLDRAGTDADPLVALSERERGAAKALVARDLRVLQAERERDR